MSNAARLRALLEIAGEIPPGEARQAAFARVIGGGTQAPDKHSSRPEHEPRQPAQPVIAYVKAGTGAKYLKMANPLKGKAFTANAVIHSDKRRDRTMLPLGGPAKHAEEGAGDGDGESMADWVCGLLNLLVRAGKKEEAAKEAEELAGVLEGTGWVVAKGPEGEYIASVETPSEGVDEFAERAPAGGINFAGKKFKGGQFIPSATIAHASPEDKVKLEKAKAAADAKRAEKDAGRKARGVNIDKLEGRLQTHLDTEGPAPGQAGRAATVRRMLTLHHGELAAHRVEEMADALEGALKSAPEGSALASEIRGRLAVLALAAKALVPGTEQGPKTPSLPPGHAATPQPTGGGPGLGRAKPAGPDGAKVDTPKADPKQRLADIDKEYNALSADHDGLMADYKKFREDYMVQRDGRWEFNTSTALRIDRKADGYKYHVIDPATGRPLPGEPMPSQEAHDRAAEVIRAEHDRIMAAQRGNDIKRRGLIDEEEAIKNAPEAAGPPPPATKPSAPVSPTSGGLADLPPQVRSSVEWAAGKIKDRHEAMSQGGRLDKAFKGEGRYTQEVADKTPIPADAVARLKEFIGLATKNGIDPHKAMAEAGLTPEVLADYPDLAAEAPPTAKPAGPGSPPSPPHTPPAPKAPHEMTREEFEASPHARPFDTSVKQSHTHSTRQYGSKKPWVARVTGTHPKYGFAQDFVNGTSSNGGMKRDRIDHEFDIDEPGLYRTGSHGFHGDEGEHFVLLPDGKGGLSKHATNEAGAKAIAKALEKGLPFHEAARKGFSALPRADRIAAAEKGQNDPLAHDVAVEAALKAGKDVPRHIIEQHPDLAAKYPPK